MNYTKVYVTKEQESRSYHIVENLTIIRDTGIRKSGHIVWLAKDNLNNKYHIRIYNNKIIQKY